MARRDTGSGRVVVDRRMYLTADRSRAVPDGDPEAAFLLCVPGAEMTRALAARYGLLEQPAEEIAEKPAEEESPDEQAAEESATETKMRTPADNKAAQAPTTGGEVDAGAVREWAAGQGLKVSARGKIPAEVLEAYRAAHQQPGGADQADATA